MKISVKKIITLIFRFLIGAIFVYASWDKILHPFVFSANIDAYEILPPLVLYIASIWTAWMELFCGVLLLLGIWTRTAAFVISVMLVIFMIGIIRALFLGIHISCGCFETGSQGDVIGWPHVIEDAVMLAASFWIVLFPYSPGSLWIGEASLPQESNG